MVLLLLIIWLLLHVAIPMDYLCMDNLNEPVSTKTYFEAVINIRSNAIR